MTIITTANVHHTKFIQEKNNITPVIRLVHFFWNKAEPIPPLTICILTRLLWANIHRFGMLMQSLLCIVHTMPKKNPEITKFL